jgi:ABC-2 type transport system ATP-binding protein
VHVDRPCHLCGDPLEGEVAYTRTVEDDGARRRVYAHPVCVLEDLPEDERDAYRRERLGPADEADPPAEPGADRASGPEAASDRGAARPADVGDAVIEVRGLAKTYPDGTRAVDDVDFTVQRGEIFGLLGPNGAGKSTLIGMLGTLVKPTEGTARVSGFDVTEDPGAIKPRLGFAMQEVGVDDLATGREFLVLQARLYGLDRDTARQRADELLERFGLTDAAGKRIDGYSGGMQRRVDLAGALIREPDIVFLDEPTEGLDPRGRREMWALVRELNDELDATILLSTHYMEEADALCDRLAILDRGRIVARGTPAELKARVGGSSLSLAWGPGRDGAAERARELLADADGIEGVRRTEDGLQVHVDDPARATPPILRALEAADLAPESLEVRNATLDDVYLATTGRSMEVAEHEDDGTDPAEAVA